MNHPATSQDQILEASLQLAAAEGFSALNMRRIAETCSVSVGCVYRYFPDKSDLMIAVVGKVWEQIFREDGSESLRNDFRASLRWVFSCIRSGCAAYPSFFQHHAAILADADPARSREVMDQYLSRIQSQLLDALKQDPAVRQEAFDDSFTREALVRFLFENLLELGMRQGKDCSYLLTLTERLIY